MSNEIAITGLGGITAVANNVELSCAVIRANIMAFSEHVYYKSIKSRTQLNNEPLIVANVPFIDPYIDKEERLYQLAVPALKELIINAQYLKINNSKCGIFVALPQDDIALSSWNLGSAFIPLLCERLDLHNFKIIKSCQNGHSGMFSLINDAILQLNSGELDYCIVGGVDSWLFEERLKLLDLSWRIKSDRNVDGFIPGEAAFFIMLEKSENVITRKDVPLSQISAIAEGHELQTINSEQQSTGIGLATALTKVIENEELNYSYDWVISDLNGESYRAFEWGLMLSRLGKPLENIKAIDHPAGICGDIGAATGGLLVACATQAYQKGYNIADKALLWSSSDSGQRMALTLIH